MKAKRGLPQGVRLTEGLGIGPDSKGTTEPDAPNTYDFPMQPERDSVPDGTAGGQGFVACVHSCS